MVKKTSMSLIVALVAFLVVVVYLSTSRVEGFAVSLAGNNFKPTIGTGVNKGKYSCRYVPGLWCPNNNMCYPKDPNGNGQTTTGAGCYPKRTTPPKYTITGNYGPKGTDARGRPLD